MKNKLKKPIFSLKTVYLSIGKIRYIKEIYERQIWEAGFNYAVRKMIEINKNK